MAAPTTTMGIAFAICTQTKLIATWFAAAPASTLGYTFACAPTFSLSHPGSSQYKSQ
jgi:hypothetical protein